MLLQSAHTAFDLEVLGYENPHGGSTSEDKNLLLTCLRITDKGRGWQTIAPLLHTWEVQHLIDWFSDILNDREVPDQLSFLEPCIAIKLSEIFTDKERFCFQLLFRYEAVPPWWNQPLHKPYVLSVECKRPVLCRAIRYLSSQIASYSVR